MTDKNDFSLKNSGDNPFDLFDKWYNERLNSGTEIPGSVALGTASPGGSVSIRMVLLKSYDESGFVFFTNYNSKKGIQLNSMSQSAMLFYWPELRRQVRIEGISEKVPLTESEHYFKTRPRESQIAAWASAQSREIPDRQYLEDLFEKYSLQFESKEVPRPSYWGGFRLVPHWFEFWEEGKSRMHYRVSYTKKNSLWIKALLAP